MNRVFPLIFVSILLALMVVVWLGLDAAESVQPVPTTAILAQVPTLASPTTTQAIPTVTATVVPTLVVPPTPIVPTATQVPPTPIVPTATRVSVQPVLLAPAVRATAIPVGQGRGQISLAPSPGAAARTAPAEFHPIPPRNEHPEWFPTPTAVATGDSPIGTSGYLTDFVLAPGQSYSELWTNDYDVSQLTSCYAMIDPTGGEFLRFRVDQTRRVFWAQPERTEVRFIYATSNPWDGTTVQFYVQPGFDYTVSWRNPGDVTRHVTFDCTQTGG